ncbi:unnamed protein product [Anisakis simplex]|uniref:Matrix metalloproteinase-23 (inferred by orthology to a human protein) n=1 Tax=Anisakis simplex TaxID=6269 RepID=A0A0M3JNP0_ANISI|nr:unnamed protein product [Anisakis simplex]
MNCYLWAIIVNVVITIPLSLALPRRHQLALQHPEVSELREEEHRHLDPLSPEDAKNYLQKYGHIAPSNVLGANVLGRSRAENREDLREVLRKGIMCVRCRFIFY